MGAPEVILDGEVIEAEAPHRLVQTWNPLFGPPVTDEPATRITWEIREDGYGGTRLTVTHELDGAPVTAGLVDRRGRDGRRRLGLRAQRSEDAAWRPAQSFAAS